jgi:hypothetical protein
MKKLKFIVAAVGALLWFTAAVPVYAQDPPDEDPPAQTTSGVWGACEGDNSTRPVCADKSEADGVVKKIINLFLYAIGVLSVIMIVWSGLKYTTSRGDAEAVKSAKNTLLYAVIGIIVAALAFTIVNFVVDSLK